MSFVVVDHLVVAAATLDEGAAWCQATLGVAPGPGGRHALMGTHNRLLSVASDTYAQAYLEILAIDAEAPAPERRRWFGLDDIDLSAGPRLIHWVARSPMLDMHRWGLITLGLPPGEPVAFSRESVQGPLQWQLTVPADGRLLCGGALPSLIQWQGRHPADGMPTSGVTLRSLSLGGLPLRARELLRPRGVGSAASDNAPALQAVLSTPRGELILSS